MSNYSALKTAIQQAVYTNGNNEITGAGLQSVLLQIVDTVGGGYTFAGVGNTGTSPGTPDQNVFYIVPAGTYANFGSSYTVNAGEIGVFTYNGGWSHARVKVIDIVDDLVSSDTDKALSANQGRVLSEDAENVKHTILGNGDDVAALNMPLNDGLKSYDFYSDGLNAGTYVSIYFEHVVGTVLVYAYTSASNYILLDTITQAGTYSYYMAEAAVKIRIYRDDVSVTSADGMLAVSQEKPIAQGVKDNAEAVGDVQHYSVGKSSTAGRDIHWSGTFKQGDILKVKVSAPSSPTTLAVSLYTQPTYVSTQDYITLGSADSSKEYVFVLPADGYHLRLYSSVNNVAITAEITIVRGGVFVPQIDGLLPLKTDVADIEQVVGDIQHYGVKYAGRDTHWSGTFKQGDFVKIKTTQPVSPVVLTASLYTQPVYVSTQDYIVLGVIDSTKDASFILPTNGYFLRLYASDPAATIDVDVTIVRDGAIIPQILPLIPQKKNIGNVLVLGDSYSAQKRWINNLSAYVSWDSMVNLAVGSATMKDAKDDRTAYPYTSRPSGNGSAQGTDNLNTFACQIEKMERLMAGVDLDAGETQIYTSADQYPDIIFIQGGKNDTPDVGYDEASYWGELFDVQTAYVQSKNGGAVTQASVNLIKDLGDILRTNFAGAMYYVSKRLYGYFPDAKIVFINPSNAIYGTGQMTYGMLVSKCIKMAASMMSIPVIDWNADGRLSFVFENAMDGAGTAGDPYIYNTESDLTLDLLHPNDDGAELLARVVAEYIKKLP